MSARRARSFLSDDLTTIEHMFVESGGKPPVEMKLGSSDLLDAPIDWLEREIGELAAHIAAATCRWLGLVAEFDRRDAHEAWGFHSCGAWISWRCSIDPRSAREHVRVARVLGGLPLIREEFSQGKLSYSKVRAITRISTPEIEEELLEMARFATAAQLERIVRGYRRAVSLETAEAAHRDRFLRCEWEEDGSLYVRARLSPEDGALFLKAIESGDDSIRQREQTSCPSAQGGSAEPEPKDARPTSRRVNGADALTEMAERSLAASEAPRPAAERRQVVVHAELDALADGGNPAGCGLQNGPAICAESARRLACDATIVPILHGSRGTLDIGRKTRAVPATMRRALEERDGGRCRFPGCENHRWIDAHHVIHWARGGKTKLDNLVLLCGHHHRLVHEGGFGVSRRADGAFAFRRPDGKPLPDIPAPAPGSVKRLRDRNRRERVDVLPVSLLPLGRGEPFDRELAVAGLLARAGP